MILTSTHGVKAANIDSIKTELEKYSKSDTTRIRILLYLSNAYVKIQTDTSKMYAQQAYKLAKEYGHYIGVCNSLSQIGTAYYSKSMFDSAKYYYEKALALAIEKNYTEDLSVRYNNLGNLYLRTGKYKTSLAYYDTVIHYAQIENNIEEMARARNNIATIYYEQGSYKSALKYYLQGIKILEDAGKTADVETTLLNLANVYFRLNNYDKALEYAHKAYGMATISGSKWVIVSVYTTYSMIFQKQEKYDSSLHYQFQALHQAELLNNTYLINLLKTNIAELYLDVNKIDSSEILYREAIEVSKKIGDREGELVAIAGLGKVLITKGDRASGVPLLEDVLQTFMDNEMREDAFETSQWLANSYSKAGNYTKAYKYLDIKDKYRDTMAKDEALKAATSMEYDYELDKKEARIKELEKDQILKETRDLSQRVLLAGLIIGILLMGVIAYLTNRNLQQAKKKNELITQQKEEIECQAKKLEDLNKFKDTTFSVLSHDLRSPINALTAAVNLLDEGIITPEEFKVYREELNNKLEAVNLMLDNLLLWARSQMSGEHTLDIEKISIKRKVLKGFAVARDAAKQKNIQLIENIPDNLYAHADRVQMEMVFRNIISNAVKFTPDGGSITVDAEQNKGKVVVRIKDTGVGMTDKQMDALFDGSPNKSTAGTGGEKGTGIGMLLSYEFVKNNSGEMTVESVQGDGTTFTLSIPADNS
ncbi:MAG: tetratricopeptide repeat-containing sensor histidine kinase [Chitinophagales bacterium]|nr:tetratricopeptide repeat-containing sensor histidine kinase [Chitinophagaceae bacterium]MCB9066030.1 tetratricopeptide repeat-containing sensor histidine kinase [Chitinophagales bacterium]